MVSYDICLSLSGLFHLVWSSLGLSMLLPMILFYFFVWLSNTLYIYIYIYIYTHTYIHTYVCVCVCVCGRHIFFIRSSINGHSGCVSALATVNNASGNIGMHVSYWIMVFSEYTARSGIAGCYDSTVCIVLRGYHSALTRTGVWFESLSGEGPLCTVQQYKASVAPGHALQPCWKWTYFNTPLLRP